MNWFDAVCHGFSAVVAGRILDLRCEHRTFRLAGYRAGADRIPGARRLEFRNALSRVESARCAAPIFAMPKRKRFSAVLAASCVGHRGLPGAERHVRRFPDRAAARDLQCRVHRHGQRAAHARTIRVWPIFAPMWMMFLSCIVASSGSAGGGIKMIRTLVLSKQAHRELNLLVHPNMVRPLKVGGMRDRQPGGVRGARVRLPLFHEHRHAGFRSARERPRLHDLALVRHCLHQQCRDRDSALWGPRTTTGASAASRPGYAPPPCCLGRLEIFTLLVLFTPTFWRK